MLTPREIFEPSRSVTWSLRSSGPALNATRFNFLQMISLPIFRWNIDKGRVALWSLIGMFFCAGLALNLYVIPLNARSHTDREARIVALNAELKRITEIPNDILNSTLGSYPGFAHLSAVLTDLQATSLRNGVVVLDTTCHPVETKGNTILGQVQISTRVKGNYRDIKNVLSALLSVHESLSIDVLAFRRPRASDPLLDAEVRMTLYYLKVV